jgi:crossover junction endodeoxyribonuclease RuvC
MRVLGIDPGTLSTGYGLVETIEENLKALEWGAIRPPKRDPLPLRLQFIQEELEEVIRRTCPEAVAVEDIFFARDARTALKLGQARGVAIVAAARLGVEIATYSALAVKQAVVGYGRAEKQQVQVMAAALLHLTELPQPDDASDALALAICHLHSLKPESYLSFPRNSPRNRSVRHR